MMKFIKINMFKYFLLNSYSKRQPHKTDLFAGVRPFQCTMCDKTYGRRDYLQRHLKSHNANFTANLSSAGGGNMSAGPMTKAIKMQPGGGQNQQIQVVQVPQGKICFSSCL